MLNLPHAVETYFTLVNGVVPISDCILRLTLAPCLFVLGRRIRRLDNGVRKPAVILCLAIVVLNAVVYPALTTLLGLAVNAYLMYYLILSTKANVVFSDQYAEVIRQTPHVRIKTSRITMVLLLCILVLLGAFALSAYFEISSLSQ